MSSEHIPEAAAEAAAPTRLDAVLPADVARVLQFMQLEDQSIDGRFPPDHATHPDAVVEVEPYYLTKDERLVGGVWGVKVEGQPMTMISGHHLSDGTLDCQIEVAERVGGKRQPRPPRDDELTAVNYALAGAVTAIMPTLEARDQARLRAADRAQTKRRFGSRLADLALGWIA